MFVGFALMYPTFRLLPQIKISLKLATWSDFLTTCALMSGEIAAKPDAAL